MPPTDRASRAAVCSNASVCGKAAAGEAIEFYPGPGEYCPECGEALTASDTPWHEASAPPPGAAPPSAPVPPPRPAPANVWRPPRRETGAHLAMPLRWLFLVALALGAGCVFLYMQSRPIAAQRAPADVVTICPIPSSRTLAAELVRAYAAQSGAPARRFRVGDSASCDVRFSIAVSKADTPIARDGLVAIVNPLNPVSRISEKQLRAVYSGAVSDWSQLGGMPGRIFALLPGKNSDEAKVLSSSLFYGLNVDGIARRKRTSADVARAVTQSTNAGLNSIGLVALREAVPGKVVPLAYLPPPSDVAIATGRYPYTLTIAVEAASQRADAAASGFLTYARSRAGAQIVAKNGFVKVQGL